MKRVILIAGVCWFAGCASVPEKVNLPGPPVAVKPSEKPEVRIDYIGLQNDLGLEYGIDQLGYHEKIFDSCRAGRGFSHSDDCHREYFVLLHFQLLCRPNESNGYTELTEADTQAISNRQIDWLLQNKKGQVVTDSSGYGQIRMTYPVSPRERHIKLNSGRKFLHMEAGELTKIVTPPDWCLR